MLDTKNIEFLTVALETCSFLEKISETGKKNAISRLLKILPLLYLKASLLDTESKYSEEELPQRFVTEYDYEHIRLMVAEVFGAHDDFLDIYHPDMQLSETPVLATISEKLADIYQELKDFVLSCQYGDENIVSDALHYCLSGFASHWGQKMLSAMQALHAIYYSQDEEAVQ